MQFLSSWNVGGLAVDWFTGNVYVTEKDRQLIAVARYNIHDDNMYRVIISSGLHQPTTVALDPYVGLVLYLLSILWFTNKRANVIIAYRVPM